MFSRAGNIDQEPISRPAAPEGETSVNCDDYSNLITRHVLFEDHKSKHNKPIKTSNELTNFNLFKEYNPLKHLKTKNSQLTW